MDFNKLSAVVVAFLFVAGTVLLVYGRSFGNDRRKVMVTKVIDGDTVIVEGGKRVRLLGVDTDERGYRCYIPAKKYLESMVLGEEVELLDRGEGNYDRILGYLFLNGTNVNLEMVRSGMGVARVEDDDSFSGEIREAESEAMEEKRGCKWAPNSSTVEACSALNYAGMVKTVVGNVSEVYESDKMTFLNFGSSYPDHCFSVVVGKDLLTGFNRSLESFRGESVRVTGRVEMYNGKPEISVSSPSDLEIR